MDRVNKEQLEKALQPSGSTPRGSQLQKRVSSEDGLRLLALLEKTAKRYPSQDNEETIPEMMADFEQLTVRHGLAKVESAFMRLRIDPEQEFFPKPNEIAAEIQREALRNAPSHLYARG